MNINNIKKAYLIGIKGVMMTAIAQLLKEQGIEVSGSDIEEKFFTDKILDNLGISYKVGFNKSNIPKSVDLVIHSVAYNARNNPELKEAKSRGLKIVKHPVFLSEIVKNKFSIGIAGSHGKSTITSWLGHTLDKLKMDPTVIAGTEIIQYGSNARSGQSEYLVIEADEYRGSFLNYDLKGAVITSMDWDHPDVYPDKESYYKVFEDFIKKIPKDGFLVVNGDNLSVRQTVLKSLEIKDDSFLHKDTIQLDGYPRVYFYGSGSGNFL